MSRNEFIFSLVLSTLISFFVLFYFRFFSVDLKYFPVFIILSFIILKLKDKIVGKLNNNLVNILLLFLISSIILINAGIFDRGIITLQDYPIHYFVHWFIIEKAIPLYKSYTGVYHNYQLGYVPIYDYPPGSAIVTYLILLVTLFKIPLWLAFRLNVYISFVFSVIAVYFFAKKVKFEPFICFLSSILYISYFHKFLLDGTFISYYSFSFSLFSIAYFLDYLDKKREKDLLISSLFLGLIILFQPMFFPYTLLVLFVISLYSKRYQSFLLLLVISIFVGSSYVFTFLTWKDYSFQIFSRQQKIFPHQYNLVEIYGKYFLSLSFFQVWFSLPSIFIAKNRKEEKIFILMLFSFFLSIFIIFINLIQISNIENKLIEVLKLFVNFFLIERGIMLLRVFFCLTASFTLFYIIKESKKWYEFLISMLVFSIFLFFVFVNFKYLLEGWRYGNYENAKYIFGHTLSYWYSQNYSKGAFSYSMQEEVEELFVFLKENTTKEARILIEDSRFGKHGGNIMAVSSLLTDRFYVGGMYQGILIDDTSAVDGVFFGRNIDEWRIKNLEEKLNEYNIKWIVCWTDICKSVLSKYSIFRKIYSTSKGKFEVYDYLNSKNSYIYPEDLGEVKIYDNEIHIYLDYNKLKYRSSRELILKFRNEKGWKFLVDNKEIRSKNEGMLIKLEIPDNSSKIIMKYEVPRKVYVGQIISSLFIFLVLITIFYKGRRKSKNYFYFC